MPVQFTGKVVLDKRSLKGLENAIIEKLSTRVSELIANSKDVILTMLREKVKARLMNSPEIRSLSGEYGKLRLELGVERNEEAAENLVNDIVKNIQINLRKEKRATTVAVSVKLKLNETYEDLYNKPYASYTTDNGTHIPWLEWLLEAGNADVIFDYRVKYKVGHGRTGGAVMVPSHVAHWRVPPEFSGTLEDNFITRSLENIDKDLTEFIGTLI